MLSRDSHHHVRLHQVPNRQTRWVHQEIAPRPHMLTYRDFKPEFVFYTQHRVDQLNS